MEKEPNKSIKQWAIIDSLTGEITKTNSSVKTKQEKEQKALDKLSAMNEQGLVSMKGIKKERHSRVYHARRLPFDNFTYKGYMSDIGLLLAKYTNEICHITDQGRCYPMGHNDLMEFLGLSKSSYYRFIKEAKSKGVISEATFDTNDVKRTTLVVNPAYVNNGMYLNVFTYKAFATDETFMSILTEHHIEQYDKGILALAPIKDPKKESEE